MAKYINRDELVEWLKRIPLKDLSDGLGLCRVIMEEDFKRAIRTIPEGTIIDVASAAHGRWINVGDGAWAVCSECGECYDSCDNGGEPVFMLFCDCYKYCPNCGARMDGGACNQVCKYNTPDCGCVAGGLRARCDLANVAGERGNGEAG